MKKWPGNKPKNKMIFKAFWNPKKNINKSRNHFKIKKILLFATSRPSCWSHGPPGWSRGAKMVSFPRCSRDAKMASQDAPEVPKLLPEELPRCENGVPKCQKEGTEFPKWHPRRKKQHDMLKWMLGCFWSVQMVSRTEIEYSSKIKF